ncbi:MAG: T9SS type A sorting domain-containing protein [Candidatus Marinimicrobia bacterium]|nr:T9SS type A sorting domain-containing protein [Candidatus Neomarinimicrobiota bacterium]
MKKIIQIMTLFLLPFSLIAQNNVCFNIEDNPNSSDPALGIFSKYVNVLDCIHVYAESNISDEKILHVAAVAAELLDNNEDGIIDDPMIEASLRQLNTIMPVFRSENGSSIDTFFDNFEDEGCIGAVLFRNEIDPSQPGHWGDDASVEEILHTINACGHVEVYPTLYALSPNSSELTDAMDVARGGQFMSIPNPYPDEAWYHYDDWTCDYECMAMEYLYWCIVTNMGILADTETCNGIGNEWEPCTPALFESTDTLMFNLVTNIENKLPQLAPDGNYCPENVSTKKNINPHLFSIFSIYPNPFNPSVKIQFSIPVETQLMTSLHIYDITGQLVETLVDGHIESGQHEIKWDASDFSSGVYFAQLTSGNKIKTEKIILLK